MRSSIVTMAFLANSLLAVAIGQQGPGPAPAASSASTQGTTAPVMANPHYPFTPADKVRKNPEKFTADSVEAGRKLFVSQCAMCHGVTGNGKGDLAATLKLSMPDFTKSSAVKGYTDGEVFKILSVGNGVMPGQAQRLSDTHLWEIVNFLRAAGEQSLRRQEPAQAKRKAKSRHGLRDNNNERLKCGISRRRRKTMLEPDVTAEVRRELKSTSGFIEEWAARWEEETLPAVRSITEEIAPRKWDSFFTTFAYRHHYWPVTIEQVGPDIGYRMPAENQPMASITTWPWSQGSAILISLIVAKPSDLSSSFVVSAARHIWLKRNENGMDEALEIEAADGTVTILHLSPLSVIRRPHDSKGHVETN